MKSEDESTFESKKSDLLSSMQKANKAYGDRSMLFANEVIDPIVIDTGIFAIDYAFAGGFAEGQTHLVVGYEGSGKSTICLKTCARAQEKYPDSIVVYCDIEGTFDSIWAEKNGVDLDRLLLIQPNVAEQAVDMMIGAMEKDIVKLVIVDSIALMSPEAMSVGSAFDNHVASLSKVVSNFFKKALPIQLSRRKQENPVTVIMINQWRYKIGVTFGDNRVLPGGEQQRYQVSSRIDLIGKEVMDKDPDTKTEIVSHNEHKFTISKFKGPKKIKQGQFDLVRETGSDLPMGAVDDYKTVISMAKKYSLISGGGSKWTVYGIDETFRNHEEIRAYLIKNPIDYIDLKASLISLYRQEVGLPELPPDNYLLRYQGEKV